MAILSEFRQFDKKKYYIERIFIDIEYRAPGDSDVRTDVESASFCMVTR